MNDLEAILSEKELEEGWHFCRSWDDLLIHKTNPEFMVCECKGFKDEII